MKINAKQDGSARILRKALQSVFGPASSEKVPVVMTQSVCNLVDMSNVYSFPKNDIQSISSDLSSWVENNRLAAIDETLRTVPSNGIEEWAKRNRLQALTQLGCIESFSTNLYSPCTTFSNDESSPIALGDQISSESFQNSLSTKNNSLTDELISETKCESEKCGSNFAYLAKESALKDVCVKNSGFQDKSHNCCEPKTRNKSNVARLPSYDVAALMNVKSSSGFIDAHCHIDLLLNDENFNGTYAEYMAHHKDSYPNSYNGCIAVFCKPWTFAKGHVWRKHLEQNNVWAAFGCHPKQAKYYNSDVERFLEQALNHPKVKALGEIGLDYSKNNERFKEEQLFVFRRQLKIAQKRKLPVVIHCRDADDDAIKTMLEILSRDTVFHLHCFTGTWERAQMWIEKFPNVFIGITNLVTFPNAAETHEVARQIPLNRLLLETDAPFFVPKKAPKGTKYAHPGMAIHVAAQIAALRNISVDEILQITNINTRYVYNIS